MYITLENEVGDEVEISTSEVKVIADIYNEHNEVIWEVSSDAYKSVNKVLNICNLINVKISIYNNTTLFTTLQRESSSMTIDGVNVLTSLNQDIASDLTASISSETYLVSENWNNLFTHLNYWC